MNRVLTQAVWPLPPEWIKELVDRPNLRWSSPAQRWVCKGGNAFGAGFTPSECYKDWAFTKRLTEVLGHPINGEVEDGRVNDGEGPEARS